MIYIPEPNMAVSAKRTLKKFSDASYVVGGYDVFGPTGFRFKIAKNRNEASELKEYQLTGAVIVSQDEIENDEWIHASISWTQAMPSYEDLKLLHQAVFANRFAYQVFSKSESHVNIHAHALHLWGKADGKNVLPDFGKHGSI